MGIGQKKIKGLKRIHVYVDAKTLSDFDWMVDQSIDGNRSRLFRQIIQDETARMMRAGSSGKRRMAGR